MEIETLLEPVSQDAPCGANLEYTDAFREMEAAAAGKAAQHMGAAAAGGQEPDWVLARKAAQSLLAETKDLRVALLLARAATRVDGAGGLRDGLQIIQGLIERYWAALHPLEEDDADDPGMRLNALTSLNHPEALLADVHTIELVASRAAGRFTVRDLRAASGELKVEEPPDPKLIDAAFLDCELDALQETAGAIAESASALAAIDAQLSAAVGAERVPDFADLGKLLSDTSAVLQAHLEERVASTDETAAGAVEGAGAGGNGGSRPTGARVEGAVTSREDVVRLLDQACEYYRRYEPGSPVPLLLERAKRLIAKDFMAIIRDLAPDGANQAANVCGVSDND